MKRLAASLLWALACEPSPPTPAEAPNAEVEETKAAPPEQPAEAQAAPAPQPHPEPLCVRMCSLRSQARAVGAETIARDCAERCAGPAPDTCADAAAEARSRVEAVPMNERAAVVWAEISKPQFYCGHTDPLIRGLATAATSDLDARARALTTALAADPFAADTCPTGVELGADATATDAIEGCKLEVRSEGWHDDVDAATFLASRAVRLRLEALGLYADDRKILLHTLALSTALTRGG